jgi:hypothetical protein
MTNEDVTTFHNDRARTGAEVGEARRRSHTQVGKYRRWAKRYEVHPPGHPPTLPSDVASQPWYPSAVRGAPLFLSQWRIEESSRHGHIVDLVIVATSDGSVYAYDHSAAKSGPPPLLWQRLLGPARIHYPRPAGYPAPGGRTTNIPLPVGITSTPVIDRACRRLFVVAQQEDAHRRPSYWIYALEIDTGRILQRAQLVDPGAQHRPQFDPFSLDQRGGLNLVGGWVYVVFSDIYGYDIELPEHAARGWIVGCKANDLSDQRYASVTRTVHGGGMWAAGGVSADARNRLYAATGTGLALPAKYWSDLAVKKKHPGDLGDYFMGVVQAEYNGTDLHIIGWYQPNNHGGTGHDIKTIQENDNDLGSCSVLVLNGIYGRNFVLTSGKDGDAYLLDADAALGHYGGHVDRVTVFDGNAVSAPAYWQTSDGDHVVFLAGTTLAALKIARPPRSAKIKPSAPGHWITGFYKGQFHSKVRFATTWAGSPVVAANPPHDDDALVWVAEPLYDTPGPTNSGVLYALRALTGEIVFDSRVRAADSVGPLPHFPSLTAAGSFVFVGTNYGYACYEHRWVAKKPKVVKVKRKVKRTA